MTTQDQEAETNQDIIKGTPLCIEIGMKKEVLIVIGILINGGI